MASEMGGSGVDEAEHTSLDMLKNTPSNIRRWLMKLSSVREGRSTLLALVAPRMVLMFGGTSVRFQWRKMVSVEGTSHPFHCDCSMFISSYCLLIMFALGK